MLNNCVKIEVKKTGEIKTAVYAYYRGNMRYNVDGIFYNDKNFDKLFKIIQYA
ncbi:MAG: hypothetical protein V4538_15430 [Bacteroidota bacterium]